MLKQQGDSGVAAAQRRDQVAAGAAVAGQQNGKVPGASYCCWQARAASSVISAQAERAEARVHQAQLECTLTNVLSRAGYYVLRADVQIRSLTDELLSSLPAIDEHEFNKRGAVFNSAKEYRRHTSLCVRGQWTLRQREGGGGGQIVPVPQTGAVRQ